MKLIPLTQGKYATVDDDLFEELNQFKWFYHCGYARRNSPRGGGKKRHAIHMSRVVLNAPDGVQCDHISLNRLDNQRTNLRLATHAQNIHNRVAPKTNTSGFKGVDFRKSGNKYRARIQVNCKSITLGVFRTAKEAANAYIVAAGKLHGQFARS